MEILRNWSENCQSEPRPRLITQCVFTHHMRKVSSLGIRFYVSKQFYTFIKWIFPCAKWIYPLCIDSILKFQWHQFKFQTMHGGWRLKHYTSPTTVMGLNCHSKERMCFPHRVQSVADWYVHRLTAYTGDIALAFLE